MPRNAEDSIATWQGVRTLPLGSTERASYDYELMVGRYFELTGPEAAKVEKELQKLVERMNEAMPFLPCKGESQGRGSTYWLKKLDVARLKIPAASPDGL